MSERPATSSEASPPETDPIADAVSIDIGRHRVFAARRDGSQVTTVPIGDRHDGLLIRWESEFGSERVTDRLRDLSGIDDDEATAMISQLASLVAERLPPTKRVIVGVPASIGPTGRGNVVAGFHDAGLAVHPSDVIDRPVAALSGWMAHRMELSGHLPADPMLLIDNDGGDLSVAAADPASQRLLLATPISTGPDDDPSTIEERLRRVLEEIASLAHQEGLVRLDDWATVSATVGPVIVTGSAADHRALAALLQRLMPAADVMPDPITAAERCVSVGLTHLDEFDEWTCCWPTTNILCGPHIVRPAGPVFGWDAETIVVEQAGVLRFERHGEVMDVAAGTIIGGGVGIPKSLGSFPVIRVLNDGRVLVLGAQGTKPLGLQVGWPCPGDHRTVLPIEVIGRRSVKLVSDPAIPKG